MSPRPRVLLLAVALLASLLVPGLLASPAEAGTAALPEVLDDEGDNEVTIEPPEEIPALFSHNATDLRKAWILYPDPGFADNIRFWINTTAMHEGDLGGAFLEQAGWVVHFSAGGSQFMVMVRQASPCLQAGGAEDSQEACVAFPSFLQPRMFCKDGSEEDVGIQVGINETVGLSLAFEHQAIGSPGIGESITDFYVETRSFPQGDGFSCSLEGSTVIDRAPDDGFGFCVVTATAGCQPPQPEVDEFIEFRELRIQRPPVGLTVQQALDFDRETSFDLTVENTGNIREEVEFRIGGSAGWKAEVEPTEEIELGPVGSGNETATITVTVSPPDGARPRAPPPANVHLPGTTGDFTIVAESDRGTTARVPFVVEVVERVLGSDVAPIQLTVVGANQNTLAGMPVRFVVQARNVEAKPIPFDVEVTGGAAGWTLDVSGRSSLPLNHLQAREIVLTATPPADAPDGASASWTVRATPAEGRTSRADLTATVGPASTTPGGSFDDPIRQALDDAGLGILAEAGLFGLLLLLLLVVILIVLLSSLGTDRSVSVREAEPEEVEEARRSDLAEEAGGGGGEGQGGGWPSEPPGDGGDPGDPGDRGDRGDRAR